MERMDPEIATRLYVAAVVGADALAFELMDSGLSEPDESLLDARELRRDLLRVVEAARRDARDA